MDLVGVDSCKAGWFFCSVKSTDIMAGERLAAESIQWGVTDSFGNLCAGMDAGSRIFIDIPIGLATAEQTDRLCDQAARKLIGARRSSVFPPPCAEALYAEDKAQAKKLSKQVLAKGISEQSYALFPKIREVRDYLRESDLSAVSKDPATRAQIAIHEVHPEVCFACLSTEPLDAKKDSKGREQRLALLQTQIYGVRELVEHVLTNTMRKHIAPDDIIDALVALLTAIKPVQQLRSLGPDAQEHGQSSHQIFY